MEKIGKQDLINISGGDGWCRCELHPNFYFINDQVKEELEELDFILEKQSNILYNYGTLWASPYSIKDLNNNPITCEKMCELFLSECPSWMAVFLS